MYPKQQICVVTPNKEQSSRFVGKAREFIQESDNLRAEIKGGINGIHTTSQNTKIEFNNGSKIFAVVYGEGSLGENIAPFYSNVKMKHRCKKLES